MQVPDVRARLSALQVVLDAPSQVADVTCKLRTHGDAARQLRSSRAFASVLAHVLALGNFLNFGNARVGNARGFRIRSLKKLQVRGIDSVLNAPLFQNTKSLDGSSDLLRWVAEHVLTCHARLLADEVPAALHPHTKVACSELAGALQDVGRGLNAAQDWVGQGRVVALEVTAADDEGVVVDFTRVDEARGVVAGGLSQLQSAHAAATAHVHDVEEGFVALLRWYGEAASAWGSDAEFWADIAEFATRFTAACRAVLLESK